MASSHPIQQGWAFMHAARPAALSYRPKGTPMNLRHISELRPSIWTTAHYYFRRVAVQPSLRRVIVRCLQIKQGRTRTCHPAVLAEYAQLLSDGITVKPALLSEQHCDDIIAYLSDKAIHDRGSDEKVRLEDSASLNMSFGIYPAKDVIDCPHVMELVSSPWMVNLAASYLGCVPTLSCLGIQWSFPNEVVTTAQNFHRDSEDWKYLRCFVYLSDVGEGGGPHVYVKGSHKDPIPLMQRYYSEEEIVERYGKEQIQSVFGPKGTFIAADTSGIHKGELPVSAPRLVLSFTFSILRAPFETYRPVRSRHPRRLRTYTNRLFLKE